MMKSVRCLLNFLVSLSLVDPALCFNTPASLPSLSMKSGIHTRLSAVSSGADTVATDSSLEHVFEEFASFLQSKQADIISEIEAVEKNCGSDSVFSRDTWGAFEGNDENDVKKSGGITRVIQKGAIIEKGACSFTLLRGGKLTADRAAAIQGRQGSEGGVNIQEGDMYSAAALSMVLHTRSPMIPTFRSDVRIFMVEPSDGSGTVAWFGGGSDLTPYYLFDEDIKFFHQQLHDLCEEYRNDDQCKMVDYKSMKKACDNYFYLPARSEHRGVGGMFFDDMPANKRSLTFLEAVTDNWMPSWFPIIEKRKNIEYSDQQREWQLLRRGRYLEFNLLYDRGVKFGLQTANPRVEGVMVSAPPLIAWEYNHVVEENSEEERLMKILKNPIEWV